MKLARLFQDGMILQRDREICVRGEVESSRTIMVLLDGECIGEYEIAAGEFTIMLPKLEARENATLQVGDITLHNVDIGEVWIAAGQSNMEFVMEYDADSETEIASANDPHLRMYTVGRYSYLGQREEGYKAWNPWDEWLEYNSKNAPSFSAVATYFAKEIREYGVPVGIINCSWGGTSASSWIERARLENDPVLKIYVDEYESEIAKLDLEMVAAVKKIMRPIICGLSSKIATDYMMKTTRLPEDLISGLRRLESDNVSGSAGDALEQFKDINVIEISQTLAPGDEWVPGALYENMVSEICGYSAKGVIYYQGESDDYHADIYDKLFGCLVNNWREAWMVQNSSQEKLPFIFTQIAPYGTWLEIPSDRYPELRESQERASHELEEVWMASITDIGSIYDIHPKKKQPVGHRLALLARKHVYGEDILADSPVASNITVEPGKITLEFENAKEIQITKQNSAVYNGFKAKEIPANLLPPVLKGINGLEVYAGNRKLTDADCSIRIEQNKLEINSEEFAGANILVKFARTPFYQVNLYNEVGIPVKPFELKT